MVGSCILSVEYSYCQPFQQVINLIIAYFFTKSLSSLRPNLDIVMMPLFYPRTTNISDVHVKQLVCNDIV